MIGQCNHVFERQMKILQVFGGRGITISEVCKEWDTDKMGSIPGEQTIRTDLLALTAGLERSHSREQGTPIIYWLPTYQGYTTEYRRSAEELKPSEEPTEPNMYFFFLGGSYKTSFGSELEMQKHIERKLQKGEYIVDDFNYSDTYVIVGTKSSIKAEEIYSVKILD